MADQQRLRGYIESVKRGKGFSVISGWIGHEKGPAISKTVYLRINGEVVATLRGLDFREDLKEVGISGGHAGFSVSIDFEIPPESVLKIEAIVEDGSTFEFPSGSDPIEFIPEGFIETVGPEGAIGWVFDPAIMKGAGQCTIVVDHAFIVPVELNRDRFDLRYRDSSGGQPWGFSIPIQNLIGQNKQTSKLETVLELFSSGKLLSRWESSSAIAPPTVQTFEDDKSLGQRSAEAASSKALVSRVDNKNVKGDQPTPHHRVSIKKASKTEQSSSVGAKTPGGSSGEKSILQLKPNLIRPPRLSQTEPDNGRGVPINSSISAEVSSAVKAFEHVIPPRNGALLKTPSEKSADAPTMTVVSWDMGHNPVGRAFLLADMASSGFDASLTGPIFEQYGKELWPPLKGENSVPISTFAGGDFKTFFDRMLAQVEACDAQVVYVSKARLPSMLFGLLMRIIKRSALIVDVDDHELSFFPNKTPVTVDEAIGLAEKNPMDAEMPYSEVWTRLAEGLMKHIGAVTVSNVALQSRFGGVIVRHARNEEVFKRSFETRARARQRFGIEPDETAILFIGTPRPHKGIYRIAESLERLNNNKLVFVIVGSFTDARTRAGFDRFKKAKIKFFENQPWEQLSEVVSLADIVAILQDPASAIAEYQIPAKLTDALALGIPVIATRVPPLIDLIAQGTITAIESDEDLDRIFSEAAPIESLPETEISKRRQKYLTEFSYRVNASRIKLAYEQAKDELDTAIDPTLSNAVYRIAKHFGVSHPYIDKCAALSAPAIFNPRKPFDVVFFWKQNDTDIYGRRSDMMMKYLIDSGRVNRILQFDRACTLGELERNVDVGPNAALHQGNLVYLNTIQRALKMKDNPKILKRTFICRDGAAPQKLFGMELPRRDEYIDFIRQQMVENNFDSNAVAWVCPVVMEFPAIQNELKFTRVVADIVDDQRKWKSVPDYMRRVAENYDDVLKVADVVLANCTPVQEGFRDIRNDIIVVPNGAEEFAEDAVWSAPEDISKMSKPVIGYVGNLRDRIDIELIEKIATRHQDSSVVLIGSAHDAIDLISMARRHDNVHLLGVRPYEKALSYIKNFDVAIMPHLNNTLSENMNPLKLYVYFALKVPIVTTEVANISDIGPLVSVAKTHDDFLKSLERALEARNSVSAATYKKTIAAVSWRKRVNDILAAIERT